jgi:hypothetical protein
MAESNMESFATRSRRMYAVAGKRCGCCCRSPARRSSSQNTQLLEAVEDQRDVVHLFRIPRLEHDANNRVAAPVFTATQAALIRSTLLAARAFELK